MMSTLQHSATYVSLFRGPKLRVEKLNPWLLIDLARRDFSGVLLLCKETRYASYR